VREFAKALVQPGRADVKLLAYLQRRRLVVYAQEKELHGGFLAGETLSIQSRAENVTGDDEAEGKLK
jgi:hypothetical protein